MVPKYEVGKSQLKYEIETKYEIDWEDQLIRIPIDCMGARIWKYAYRKY